MKIFVAVATLFSLFINSLSGGLITTDKDNAVSASVHTDISYGEAERNKMDIYLPPKTSSDHTFGALLFIHGGSWTSGDKSSEAYLCKRYSEKGSVTATINYHYIDADHPVSTNMDDIASAINKLQSFCSENGYNVTSLALHGFSSGAHIATLFSYSCPERSVIPLAFVVNMAGPADFNSETWHEWHYDQNTGPSLAIMLYGMKDLGENVKGPSDIPPHKLQEIIDAMSPAFHINENSIPTICGYAGDGKDGIVPTKNKTITFENLKKHNVKSDCFTFENSNHILIGDMDVREALYARVDEYCKEYFGY